MPHLKRTSSQVLTSLTRPERVSLEGVRAQSPRPIEEEWKTLCDKGFTPITRPQGSEDDTCHFSLAELFGDQTSIICRQDREPSDAAMALLWRFGGACPITMVSQTQPAHLLRYIPHDFAFQHSGKPVQASAQFLLTPSTLDIRSAARSAPPHGTIIIVGTDDSQTARHLGLLENLRSDLTLFGCTGALPEGTRQMHPATIGTDAFDRMVCQRTGGSSFVAGALTRRDAAWLNQTTGGTLKAGDVIFAPFAAHGLDRSLFARWRTEMPDQVEQRLNNAIRPDVELLPLALVSPPSVDGQPGLRNLRHAIRKLGPTVVYGATGNIGSAIAEALGGKIPVTAISRQGCCPRLETLGSPRHTLRQGKSLSASQTDEDAVRTVFMTASVPWLRCPRTNRVIFDRAALLEDNLQNVLIPQLREIPAGVKVVQIITNPSSDLTYAAWLLRPDLAGAISAHVGTDIVRQHAHVRFPDRPDTWFTVGPHSPNQVNVDLAAGTIDPKVPLLGRILNDDAGDRSVIDPTGLSSIVEAARLHTHQAGCYGLPLSAEEAKALTEFMDREMGRPITVSEGIAPTLPRDSQRQIRWDMLRRAGGIPEFPDRMHTALQEMEAGKMQILEALVRRASARQPQAGTVNVQWVLDNRDKLLSM